MLSALKILLDICLLRARPDDLPSSSALLGTTLALYTLTSLALTADQLSPGRAFVFALVNSLVLALLTHIVLLLRHLPARLTQTLTALAGSGALLALVALPLGRGGEPSLLVLALLAWNIAVNAHILRHALAVSLLIAMLVTLGYMIVTFIVANALFPALTHSA